MSNSLLFLNASRFLALVTMLGYTGSMVGCGPPETPTTATPVVEEGDEHDHEGHDHEGHDHSAAIDIDELMPLDAAPTPESLSEGVAQLVAMRDTISDGFTANDPESVHDQLHSIGGLLESLEDMVESSEMSDAVKKEAAQAVEALFESFGDVDAKLHGEDGKDYADVSDKINSAVEALSNLELP